MIELHPLDLAVLLGYVVMLLAIGLIIAAIIAAWLIYQGTISPL